MSAADGRSTPDVGDGTQCTNPSCSGGVFVRYVPEAAAQGASEGLSMPTDDAVWLDGLATSVEGNPHHPPAAEQVARMRAIAGRLDISDAAVESAMRDLLGAQVEIIERFNRPLRDEYLGSLRDHVRCALRKALAS